MSNTLLGFDWDNNKHKKWLTTYFSDAKRQPKSSISIPNIKGIRGEAYRKRFELFFDKLLDSNDYDKKLRKNVISAWRSKLKQLQNHKQVNIELTSGEYEQLIKLKELRGNKSTIKDTVLDLIENEYRAQDGILMSLEDKIRKEITREVRNEIREDVEKEMINKARKVSLKRNSRQIITHENQLPPEEVQNASQANTDSLLLAKLDALAEDTNAKFEKLELMLAALIKKDASPIEEVSTPVEKKPGPMKLEGKVNSVSRGDEASLNEITLSIAQAGKQFTFIPPIDTKFSPLK